MPIPHDLNVPEAAPHYVVAVRMGPVLGTPGARQEALVTWGGYLAGPFDTFDEASEAFDRCGVLDGEQKGLYSQGADTLCFPHDQED